MAVAILILVAPGLPGCTTPRGPVRQPEFAKPPSLSDQARATYAYLHSLQLSGNEAMEALNTAIELDPDPELFLEKIHRLWKTNKYAEAEQTARKGLSVSPQHPSLTLALIRTLLVQDKDDQAMDLVHTTLDRHPEDWSLRSRLGRILLQERLPSQALSVLQAIPEKVRSANTHYFLAQAYDAMDNRRKTILHLEQATRINPTFHKAWAELGYQYELNRDFVAAQKAYSTLLDLGETSPDILLRLIEINLKLNNPNQALQVLTSRISQPEVVLSGIGLFVNNGFYELALQALQDFGPQIAHSPRGFLYRAVLVWELQNDLDRALVLLRQIPESSELHPRALALRCQLLWEKGTPSAALTLAKQAVNTYPQQEIFYTLQAKIFRSRQEPDAARRILRNGLQALPDNTELLFQLGVLEYEQDRIDEAIKHMNRIITQDPEHAQALNFLGYTLVEQERDLARAKILIQKALTLDPENGYYLDSLAWYQYTVGHHRQAWESIQTAVTLVDDDPVIWEHYGDIARALNKIDQARRGYSRSLLLEPEHPQRVQSKLEALTQDHDPDK